MSAFEAWTPSAPSVFPFTTGRANLDPRHPEGTPAVNVVYQCPECELRFRFATELDHHLSVDHPEFSIEFKSLEDAMLAAAHKRKHAPEAHN